MFLHSNVCFWKAGLAPALSIKPFSDCSSLRCQQNILWKNKSEWMRISISDVAGFRFSPLNWHLETQMWSLPPHPLNKQKKAPTASLPARSQNLEAPGSTWDGGGQDVLDSVTIWNGRTRSVVFLVCNLKTDVGHQKVDLEPHLQTWFSFSPLGQYVWQVQSLRFESIRKSYTSQKKSQVCPINIEHQHNTNPSRISCSKFQVLVDQWRGQSIRIWFRNP